MSEIRTAISENEQLSASFRTITQSIALCTGSFVAMQTVAETAIDVSRFNECSVAINNMEGAQEKLNASIEGGTGVADGFFKKMGGVIAQYASWDTVEKIAGLSDSVMQTTAKLDLMNDGFRTTEELQGMIFQAAQASRGSYAQMASDVTALGNSAGNAFANNDEIVAFAELVNKQFAIAGKSSSEASGAFSQLTQAMEAGALSGEQFEAIFSQAPNLIQDIADYLNVPIEKIGDMASSGAITSDVIKNAMFSATDDINEKLAQTPMTFEQIGSSIKNTALQVFEPILVKINEIANSEGFNTFINGAINALYLLADIVGVVFDGLAAAGAFVYDNWDIIEPAIYGVVAIIGVYTIATNASEIAQKAATAATKVWTAAQSVLSAVMSLNPITLIIIGIIALIAIIYMVVAAINNLTGASYSATGIICGAITAAGAFIWNIIVGVLNAIYSYFASVANAVIGVVEWILNVFGGGFDSFGAACANLIGNVISWFLSLGKVVTTIIDAIFGTDWTSGLDAMQDNVLSWGKNENSITLKRFNTEGILNRIEYGDAYDTGYNFGKGIDNKVSDIFGKSKEASEGTYNITSEIPTTLDTVAGNTGTAAESTSNIADSMEITEEDLKYLRDIAEREVIDRTTFKDISVNLGGVNNTVTNMGDLDGIADYLGNVISEQMTVSAEGA